MDGARESAARRIADGEVVKAGVVWRCGGSAPALPGIQADVVMIATGRYESCVVTQPLNPIEPEHACVKRQRAVDVRDFQVDVADAGAGRNAVVLHQLQFNSWRRVYACA